MSPERLERFLIARGERVVRVPTRLMATSRRTARERGKSDRSTRSLSPGPPCRGTRVLPAAALDGPELDLRLFVDHRERLVGQRVGSTTRCNGTCTISGPNSRCRAARCSRASGAPGSAGAWRGPSRRCVSGSRATSCGACASSPKRSGAGSRDRRPGRPARAAPARRAGLRAADRRQACRRDRRRRAVRLRRQARPRRGHRTDPRQLGQDQPPPTRSRRQPPDQRRDPPHRDHPRALPPRNPRLHRPQDRRRQDPREAIRCLKRHLTRRIWHYCNRPRRPEPDDHPHFLDIGAAEAIVSKRSPASAAFPSTEQCRDPTARLSRRLCLGWIFLVVPGVSGASLLSRTRRRVRAPARPGSRCRSTRRRR